MAPLPSLFPFLLLLLLLASFLSTCTSQDRPTHGLNEEQPISPAYEFFHPKTQQLSTTEPCGESNCSQLPPTTTVDSPLTPAATVDSSLAQESGTIPEKTTKKGGIGADAIAGIIFGFVFVVLLAMGAYYVTVTARRTELCRKSLVQANV